MSTSLRLNTTSGRDAGDSGLRSKAPHDEAIRTAWCSALTPATPMSPWSRRLACVTCPRVRPRLIQIYTVRCAATPISTFYDTSAAKLAYPRFVFAPSGPRDRAGGSALVRFLWPNLKKKNSVVA